MLFKQVLFVLFLLAQVSIVQANVITIATGLAKPPFIINAESGMQLDLIRQAFALSDQQVKFKPLPLNRNIAALQRFDVAGVALFPSGVKVTGVHLSKPYIIYQNVAVTLRHNDFRIDSVKDLDGKNLVAFQNAHKFLGEAFHNLTRYSLEYREVADQHQQIELLANGATEVIILDLNILRYFLREQRGLADKVNIHTIFPENHYQAAFNNAELAAKFDAGIAQLKVSGQYQQIIDSYTAH